MRGSRGATRTLRTSGSPIVTLAPDWRSQFLAVITDPSVALILMMIGIYGLIFEFSTPGMVVPGMAAAAVATTTATSSPPPGGEQER